MMPSEAFVISGGFQALGVGQGGGRLESGAELSKESWSWGLELHS